MSPSSARPVTTLSSCSHFWSTIFLYWFWNWLDKRDLLTVYCVSQMNSPCFWEFAWIMVYVSPKVFKRHFTKEIFYQKACSFVSKRSLPNSLVLFYFGGTAKQVVSINDVLRTYGNCSLSNQSCWTYIRPSTINMSISKAASFRRFG